MSSLPLPLLAALGYGAARLIHKGRSTKENGKKGLDPVLSVDASPEELGFDSERLEKLSDFLRKEVENGKLPSLAAYVSRKGKTAFYGHYGYQHVGARGADPHNPEPVPIAADTISRIYSMTKPLTAVAALMLVEEGKLHLYDPLSNYLPMFKDMQVYVDGEGDDMKTEPAKNPIKVLHVLNHTAGFTYGFFKSNPVDALYRKNRVVWTGTLPGDTMLGICERLSKIPLLHHPGEAWNYSVATDVLGVLVEVVSGMSLRDFFLKRILEPLGMTDTDFFVPPEKAHRLATCYFPVPSRNPDQPFGIMQLDPKTPAIQHVPCFNGDECPDMKTCLLKHDSRPPLDFPSSPPKSSYLTLPEAVYSGGGGLVATVADYAKFANMLACNGKYIDADGKEQVLLSRAMVAFMTRNTIEAEMESFVVPNATFAESKFRGVGFGLGVGLVCNAMQMETLASDGQFFWGGMASTFFIIDPKEETALVLFTQLVPSSTYPKLRDDARTLMMSALL